MHVMTNWAAKGMGVRCKSWRPRADQRRGVTRPRALATTNASQYCRYGCQKCRTGYSIRFIASKEMKWGVGVLLRDGKGFGERRCRACSSGCVGADWGGKETQARLTYHGAGRGKCLDFALLMFLSAARNLCIMLAVHNDCPRARLMQSAMRVCNRCCCVPRFGEETRPNEVWR